MATHTTPELTPPHAPTSSETVSTTPAAPPNRRWVMRFTTVVAILATTVSAQGMILFGTTALNWPIWFAAIGATICEAAMVAYALLAREALNAGQAWHTDMWATRILALISGTLSAAYSTVLLDHGVHVFTFDAATPFTCALRLGAPLLACELWHRVILGDQHLRADTPTLTDRRLHLRLLDVAWTAHHLNNTPPDATVDRRRLRGVLADQWRHVLTIPPHQRPHLTTQLHQAVTEVATITTLTTSPTNTLNLETLTGDDVRPPKENLAANSQEQDCANTSTASRPHQLAPVASHPKAPRAPILLPLHLADLQDAGVEDVPEVPAPPVATRGHAVKPTRAPWPADFRHTVLQDLTRRTPHPTVNDVIRTAERHGHPLPATTARRWLNNHTPNRTAHST